MSRRTGLLAMLAALGTPSAAGAATPTVDYAVTIDGTAEYNRADASADAAAQHDETVDFQTRIPKLTFYDKVAEDSRGALGTATVRRGSYTITSPQTQVRCTDHTVADVTAGGLDATFAPRHTVFATRVVDSVTVRVGGCDLPGMQAWDLRLDSGGAPVGVGRFDGAFAVPHARIGEAAMTFPLAGEVTGAACPFHHEQTALCSLTWTATVRFTRTGEGEDDGPPTLEELVLPLVAKARLAPDGRSVRLPLTCPAGCRGSLTAAAGGRTLGRSRFVLSAGRRATTVVRLRRAVRRPGALRLTLRARADGRLVKRTIRAAA
jgi:hypothetical protein